MEHLPYIGVTGPSSIEEAEKTARFFENATGAYLSDDHMPMIGILVSYKSLGGKPMINRRYPRIHSLPGILKACAPYSFTTVHYNTWETDTLAEQVSMIFRNAPSVDIFHLGIGIQLNLRSPPVKEVEKIKRDHPYLRIIFQANEHLLSSGTPEQVADNISRYGDNIDHVLIDPSGGKKQDFHLENSVGVYHAIRKAMPQINIGFAGGLSSDNVGSRIHELRQTLGTGFFSIDAEGNLRDKLSDKYGNDLFNADKTERYIIEAYKGFRSDL